MNDDDTIKTDTDSPVSSENVSWYPSRAKEEVLTEKIECMMKKTVLSEINPANVFDPWKETGVKYTVSNKWQSIDKKKLETCRRERVHGVEIRKLPANHALAGQYGLFATKRFARFDIVGEYTGKIVGNQIGGHYVAVLEDKDYDDSLGIDAEKTGNEMRFINHYLNIDFEASVIMKTVYINTYPHIVIVCKKDIEIGDELLLDYGEEYTKAYITPKVIRCEGKMSNEELQKGLPFGDSDSEAD
jgi:hypothetical protein